MDGKEFTDKIKRKLENILKEKIYWKKTDLKSIKTRIPIEDHGNKTDIDIAIQLQGLPFSVADQLKTNFVFAIEVKYRKRKGWIEIERREEVQVKKVKELQRTKRMASITYHPRIHSDITRQLKCYADQRPDLIGLVTNMPIEPEPPIEFGIKGYYHSTVPTIATRERNLGALFSKMEKMFNYERCFFDTSTKDLAIGMEAGNQ